MKPTKHSTRICLCIIVILLIAVVILAIGNFALREESTDRQRMIDRRFRTSLAGLCNNLHISITDDAVQAQVNKKNMAYAYFCFSLFSNTSYAGNYEMNSIILDLYGLVDQDALYTEIDKETALMLKEWSYRIDDAELLHAIYEKLVGSQ